MPSLKIFSDQRLWKKPDNPDRWTDQIKHIDRNPTWLENSHERCLTPAARRATNRAGADFKIHLSHTETRRNTTSHTSTLNLHSTMWQSRPETFSLKVNEFRDYLLVIWNVHPSITYTCFVPVRVKGFTKASPSCNLKLTYQTCILTVGKAQ